MGDEATTGIAANNTFSADHVTFDGFDPLELMDTAWKVHSRCSKFFEDLQVQYLLLTCQILCVIVQRFQPSLIVLEKHIKCKKLRCTISKLIYI